MVHPDENPPASGKEASEGGESPTAKEASKPPPSRQPPSRGYAYLFKYVLVGDCGVGKTSLLKRFSQNMFNPTHIYTVGVDFDVKTMSLPNGDEVKLQMWDTAGQERFRTITNSYYRGAHGILIVYDVNDRDALTNVRNWLHEVGRYANHDAFIVIVGTKLDFAVHSGDDYVGADKMQSLLKEYEEETQNPEYPKLIGAFQVSSKTGEGVQVPFQMLTEELVTQRLNERNPLRGGKGKLSKDREGGHETIRLQDAGKKPAKRCC